MQLVLLSMPRDIELVLLSMPRDIELVLLFKSAGCVCVFFEYGIARGLLLVCVLF